MFYESVQNSRELSKSVRFGLSFWTPKAVNISDSARRPVSRRDRSVIYLSLNICINLECPKCSIGESWALCNREHRTKERFIDMKWTTFAEQSSHWSKESEKQLQGQQAWPWNDEYIHDVKGVKFDSINAVLLAATGLSREKRLMTGKQA
jgi:hypothetical protein